MQLPNLLAFHVHPPDGSMVLASVDSVIKVEDGGTETTTMASHLTGAEFMVGITVITGADGIVMSIQPIHTERSDCQEAPTLMNQ